MTKIVNINSIEYEEKYLISYTIQHMLYKDKVRFYYALKGRDGKTGMVKYSNAESLARSILLISEEHFKEFIEFLGYWKCSFIAKKVYIKPDEKLNVINQV